MEMTNFEATVADAIFSHQRHSFPWTPIRIHSAVQYVMLRSLMNPAVAPPPFIPLYCCCLSILGGFWFHCRFILASMMHCPFSKVYLAFLLLGHWNHIRSPFCVVGETLEDVGIYFTRRPLISYHSFGDTTLF